ncbi:MAG: HAMP domain-containing histidine kinase, partial [Acetatifactor sp.]|nr:HAMP domain-containing histidine kinase [Acetatifactor sp.]
ITGKSFSANILLRERRLQEILQRCKDMLNGSAAGGVWTDSDRVELEREAEELRKILGEFLQETELPVEVRLLYTQNLEQEYKNETVKLHIYTDSMLILEAGIEDSENRYVNYMALEKAPDRLVISLLPVVTPEIEEIRPVVLMSLPMLGAVILLLVLLFSRVYSRGIVSPIVELVQHTEQMKYSRDFCVERMWEGQEHRRDEVGELADTLDDLYGRIRESYRQLEEKNAQLAEENRRQEVFLRASSHQLKTPIAAALLLVDGMLHQMGRYKDTQANLPRVKEQLLSMRKMVEDILFLGHCEEHIHMQVIDAGTLVKKRLEPLAALAADRKLRIESEGEKSLEILTDEALFTRILDNLLSNAVKYTPEEGRITVRLIQDGQRAGIRLTNLGGRISPQLLPHIFEPFVSGNAGAGSPGDFGGGSHGLGLYIADYYGKELHAGLSVRFGEEGVEGAI